MSGGDMSGGDMSGGDMYRGDVSGLKCPGLKCRIAFWTRFAVPEEEANWAQLSFNIVGVCMFFTTLYCFFPRRNNDPEGNNEFTSEMNL